MCVQKLINDEENIISENKQGFVSLRRGRIEKSVKRVKSPSPRPTHTKKINIYCNCFAEARYLRRAGENKMNSSTNGMHSEKKMKDIKMKNQQ